MDCRRVARAGIKVATPLIIVGNTCVYRHFRMRGIRQRPLIDPTETPHRGVYEGFMRGIEHIPLMAQTFIQRSFQRL